MTIAALINLGTGQVEGLIVAEPGAYDPGDGYLLSYDPPQFVGIGTAWDGTNFVKPPTGKPSEIDGLDTV